MVIRCLKHGLGLVTDEVTKFRFMHQVRSKRMYRYFIGVLRLLQLQFFYKKKAFSISIAFPLHEYITRAGQ
jgi:hypothetical protein